MEEGDGGEPVRGPYVWFSHQSYPNTPEKGNSWGNPDWLTICGIEKLKQHRAVRVEGQTPPTDTTLNKGNSPNPQGTTPLAQSQKPTSSQVKKGELPPEPVRWTAEKFPTKPVPTSASAPAPTPAPAAQPIDLSTISPAKLTRLALLDSMNFWNPMVNSSLLTHLWMLWQEFGMWMDLALLSEGSCVEHEIVDASSTRHD